MARIFCVVAVLSSVLACFGGSSYSEQLVRNQASLDFDCEIEDIKIYPLGNYRYLATGCFKKEAYSCEQGLFTLKNSITCKQLLSSRAQDF